jgi:hypothetical protein
MGRGVGGQIWGGGGVGRWSSGGGNQGRKILVKYRLSMQACFLFTNFV